GYENDFEIKKAVRETMVVAREAPEWDDIDLKLYENILQDCGKWYIGDGANPSFTIPELREEIWLTADKEVGETPIMQFYFDDLNERFSSTVNRLNEIANEINMNKDED